MELLIPGLILVALMVYASTRIKRTAAAAFEAETVETGEFVIQKPDGFLNNLNGDPQYIFEAYSKDFSAEFPTLRVGTATIIKIDGSGLDEAAAEILSQGTVVDDFNEVIDERHYRIITVQHHADDAAIESSFKLGQREGSILKLEVRALREDSNDQWVETFVDSFRVK
jgi:hypothetical protein